MSKNASGDAAELQKTAQTLGLPLVETERIVSLVAHDILRSVYRYPTTRVNDGVEEEVPLTQDELALNRKCEELYRKWYNSDFPEYQRKIQTSALFGPPGHGKTTSFEVAAQRVAKGLGMRYVSAEMLEHVPVEDININTFVFVSQETAGVVSALEWMGLPSSEQTADGKDKFMGRLFTQPLIKLTRAGGGVLLLDDFLNASRQIQDVGLSLTDRRRFGQLNLRQSYIGVTGNLGSLDGTNASRASSALRNRMRMFMAHDTVENFVARIQSDTKLRDELGDGFVRSFLHRYPHYFSQYPDSKQQGAYCTPRSLRDFIDEVRDCLQRFGGRKNAASAREEIYLIAQTKLGIEVANAFNSYMSALLSKADPLARQVIVEGKLSLEDIRQSYSEGGFSAKEQHFGYQYGMALVDYTVHKILQDGSMDEAIQRFGKGMLVLDSSLFSFAIDELQTKLSAQVEHLGKGSNKVEVSKQVSKDSKRRELTLESRTQVGNLILSNKDITKEQRSILINVLSDANKFQNKVSAPLPIGGRVSGRGKK